MTRKGLTIERREIDHPTGDPYHNQKKYPEPSVCQVCQLVYSKGIYKWKRNIPENAYKITCPACQRIKDDFEGGFLLLEGRFLAKHQAEIFNLIKNTEAVEKRRHPLERLISIKENGTNIEVRTTYEHLTRRIGEALQKAYKGELRFSYLDDQKYIRAWWKRDK